MKVEVEIDVLDEVICRSLHESALRCTSGSTQPEDKRYAKRYRRAVNLVLDHYGWSPPTDK